MPERRRRRARALFSSGLLPPGKNVSHDGRSAFQIERERVGCVRNCLEGAGSQRHRAKSEEVMAEPLGAASHPESRSRDPDGEGRAPPSPSSSPRCLLLPRRPFLPLPTPPPFHLKREAERAPRLEVGSGEEGFGPKATPPRADANGRHSQGPSPLRHAPPRGAAAAMWRSLHGASVPRRRAVRMSMPIARKRGGA